MSTRTALEPDVIEELRDAVRKTVLRAVEKRPSTAGAWESDAVDEALWTEGTTQGWPALLVDEEDGGAGAGMSAASVVVSELAAQLACVPYLSSGVLAVTAVAHGSSGAQRAHWLTRLASGDLRATVAVHGRGREHDVRASASRTGWRLEGTTDLALDTATAGLVVVSAELDDGSTGLFGLEGDTLTDQKRTEVLCVDRSRRLAKLPFYQVDVDGAARMHGPDPRVVLEALRSFGGVALAADAMGAAGRALDLSVAYAQDRQQFGRPIGSFQAIKHKLADMYLLVRAGTLAYESAARALDEGAPDAARAVAVAASYARDAASKVTGDAIQVHGGIGYTWDHPCHRLFKRAKLDEVLLADPSSYRQDLARLLIDRAR
jgi:alkylation response protein AidB-like acyl-CoA dehydrogenase